MYFIFSLFFSCLDSLGPIQEKIHVQAAEDTYTRFVFHEKKLTCFLVYYECKDVSLTYVISKYYPNIIHKDLNSSLFVKN